MRALISVALFLICSFAMGNQKKLTLKAGELWLENTKLTATKGKVDAFKISPSGRFAAAHKVIFRTKEHNDDPKQNKKTKLTPVYSVLIVDVEKKKVVRELTAPEELLHPDDWQADDRYRFYTGSQLDIIGAYEYSTTTDKVRKLTFDYDSGEYK